MIEHKVEGVYRDSPDTIRRLSYDMIRTYSGKLNVGEATALARVVAMSHDGSVYGFWGQLTWRHENGQYDNGDVYYSW